MKATARNDLEALLRQHLLQVLSLEVDLKPWEGEASLPEFLRDAYSFVAAGLLGTYCLFMIDRGVQSGTPAAIRKHTLEVKRKWQGEIVYVVTGIDSARRRQLIDQGVAFVVPGNQVYLPMLGVDLREHFRKVRVAGDTLSPATQAAFLYALHDKKKDAFSPQEMAASLGYSSMTMSRAFDELQSAGLGRHFTAGKRRLMELGGSPRELWEKALPLLRSPLAARAMAVATREDLGAPAAGLSALASYTNLAEPRTPVVAIRRNAWTSLRSRFATPEGGAQGLPTIEVELWNYSPAVVAKGPLVDRLSLFLSLTGTADERVEAALDELLESMTW